MRPVPHRYVTAQTEPTKHITKECSDGTVRVGVSSVGAEFFRV